MPEASICSRVLASGKVIRIVIMVPSPKSALKRRFYVVVERWIGKMHALHVNDAAKRPRALHTPPVR